ncbi:DUF3772 domain-containing protein [Shimia thalassica]|uniref:DUF3772 domain-containing protein n=1 Tax=Shimia thalassica TaxID=1715693 RepID=UPI002494935B|nr:DUF3772 domain-containing protein [Shimia thalassica]
MIMMRRLLLALSLLCLPWITMVHAQTAAPDYDEWNKVVIRATEAIETGRASDAAMDVLRGQLEIWRDTFADASTDYSISTQTLRAQLETLGPEPESGEPEGIALQRAELKLKLSEASTPTVRAELAQSAATELIAGVDKLRRDRHTEALMERGPLPVNPLYWGDALSTLTKSMNHVVSEVRVAWVYVRHREDFGNNIPRAVLFLLIGVVLISRGRAWTRMLEDRVRQFRTPGIRGFIIFTLSLGTVFLPLLGVYAFTESIYATNLAGLRGDQILSILPLASFLLLMSAWIGNRIFPVNEDDQQILFLPAGKRMEGRADSSLIGLAMAVNVLMTEIARFDSWSAEARSVLFFPIIVFSSFLMLRLSSLLLSHLRAINTEEGKKVYYSRAVFVSARLFQFGAIAAIVLGALGFSSAAEQLVFPAIATVQLLAFLLLLHQTLTGVVLKLMGEGLEARDKSLWPVAIAFVLVMLAIPAILLIWGVRSQEVADLYRQIGSGLRVGDVKISPREILLFFFIFGVGYALTRLLQSTMKNTVLPKTKLDVGGQNAVVSGIGYVGVFVAALLAINNTGIDLGSIALVASALSVGIGFGLQTIVSNFVSGIILLVERPIAEGDWIEVGGQMGYVRDISVRSTRIETFDRTDVIVPNSDLVAGTVTNYTRGNTVGRVIVPVGVAYGTDPRKVEAILLKVAKAHPMVLGIPSPYVVFQGFGASSLDFEIRAILRDVNWVLSVRSEMNYEIARLFGEEGIEIPFPQQDLWLRNPESLQPAARVEPVNLDQEIALDQQRQTASQSPKATPDNDGEGGVER